MEKLFGSECGSMKTEKGMVRSEGRRLWRWWWSVRVSNYISIVQKAFFKIRISKNFFPVMRWNFLKSESAKFWGF